MKTNDERKAVPSFDELVFENRNKEYGAYIIRQKYNVSMLWAILVGVFCISASVITPFVIENGRPKVIEKKADSTGVFFTPIDEPIDIKKIEPQKVDVVKIKPPVYVAPIIVDSIKPDDNNIFLTNDEINKLVTNDSVTDVIIIPQIIIDPVIDDNRIEEIVNISEKPYFGTEGDIEFRKWIGENIHYPQAAIDAQIQGRVYIHFVVEKDGSISNVQVMRSVDPELDQEAIRVIDSSPKWNPGKQQGRPVRVYYTFPITFVIK